MSYFDIICVGLSTIEKPFKGRSANFHGSNRKRKCASIVFNEQNFGFAAFLLKINCAKNEY